jgi:vacuolar protein sorting-associated protein 52
MTVIVEENKKLMHKKKITVLDYFFDKINMLLWPRFSTLFDGILDNIKKNNMANFKLYNQTTVHASTIKYAELIRSLTMVAPHLSQDMLILKLGSLRVSFVEFL